MNEECKQVLWELGRENVKTINEKNGFGDTPLHTACICKHLRDVKVLIENDANVNEHGQHGHTPLFIAIEDGSFEIVKILLEHGADPLLKNDWGFSALSYAQAINPESNVTRLIELHLQGKA